MHNLLQGGFSGPIMPVNPKHQAVSGVLTYSSISKLPLSPDLAVICTPPHTIPTILKELGVKGTKAVVILTAGVTQQTENNNSSLPQTLLEIARSYTLRILGPNSLGLLVPSIGLNASFAHTRALPGELAFISQSGALCTSVLDWALSKGIGFSHFVSLGDELDVDFGDLLDCLGSNPSTQAILLYIESITDARKFMSAARASARNKPILAIKAGRQQEGARAAASHTGALTGSEEVYDAAFKRAGILRVYEIDELFDAVETLGRAKPFKGDRLAILTNGGGPAVMATDVLVAGGGHLAQLSQDTVQQLDSVLPPTWSKRNPVDIIGDASGERYAKALHILVKDPGIDALLVSHAPTAIVSSQEAAQAIVSSIHNSSSNKNILTSWLGDHSVVEARRLFAENQIPDYETPEKAIKAFMHIVKYHRNLELLMETPPSTPKEFTPVMEPVRLIIEQAMVSKRTVLSEPEAKAVLAAYGIPTVETRIASDAEEAVRLAKEIGFPVALKIISPDVSHKSDVGGVVLDLDTPEAVRASVAGMYDRLAKFNPDARMSGITVQPMARRPGAYELIVGVTCDSMFGPVILFGQGGEAVEVLEDKAVALPPLNMKLAQELINATRISKLLKGFRTHGSINFEALCLTLIQISHLLIDHPEIIELDINPLLANQDEVFALDARMKVAPAPLPGPARLAIRPYPKELEEWITLPNGRKILCRPIRPEDEPAHNRFFSQLSPEDIRFRFFGLIKELPHSEMARFTQIDYDREMAFIAIAADDGRPSETLGVVRAISDPNNRTAEFAIIVRSDLKGQGLGQLLLEKMKCYCRERGTGKMVGQVRTDNTAMLGLAKHLGFSATLMHDETDVMEVTLLLRNL